MYRWAFGKKCSSTNDGVDMEYQAEPKHELKCRHAKKKTKTQKKPTDRTRKHPDINDL